MRRDGVFPAIIDQDTYLKAQEVLRARRTIPTDTEMLDGLQTALRRAGSLSADVIHRAPGLKSRTAYRSRFGGLLAAYRRIGYQPPDNYEYIEINEQLTRVRDAFTADIEARFADSGAALRNTPDPGLFTINENLTLRFKFVRCRHTKHRGDRWIIHLRPAERADITIAARMTSANDAILDYYVYPRAVPLPEQLDIGLTNGAVTDVHQFNDLSGVINLFRCVHIGGRENADSPY